MQFLIWLILAVVAIVIAVNLSARGKEFSLLAWVIAITGVFSPMYLEYPEFGETIIAVNNGVMEEYPFGVFKLGVEGRLVRMPSDIFESWHTPIYFQGGSPFQGKLPGVTLVLRVVDKKKYVAMMQSPDADIRDGIGHGRNYISQSLDGTVIAYQIQYVMEQKEQLSKEGYETFMRGNLTPRFALCGLEIVQVKASTMLH
jgi:hypothetical protein